MSAKHCVVVGGGLAGLAAAYRMTQKHGKDWKVTLLEATGRLGGRVKSHHFQRGSGLVCELGGEWIGKNHKEMQRLCCAFDLPLQPHQYSNSFSEEDKPGRLFPPGAWCLSARAQKAWKAVTSEFQKQGFQKNGIRGMDKLDWWTYLEMKGFPRKDLLRRDLMDSTDFGETIRMNSAYTAAAEYISTPGEEVDDSDEMDFKVAGGNQKLVKALESAIGSEHVRRRWQVTGIHHENGGVTVRGKNQEPIRANACVFAAPAHYIRQIAWDRDFPEEKLEASKELQYARITKTAVLCAKRFWRQPNDDSGYSVCTDLASDFVFDSTFGQQGRMGILCSYSVGDKADDIDRAAENDLMYWIVEDVAKANGHRWPKGKIRRVALDVRRQAWPEDEFTGGAYAFYRPGQWFTVRPALARPFKKIFFAGEHIADWQGFMEGAVVTGQKAADAAARC